MESEYRIKRNDSNNITLQRKTEFGNWVVIAYCGNNLNSLIRALLELPMVEYTPEDEKLSDALEKAQSELVSARTELTELIKNYIPGMKW